MILLRWALTCVINYKLYNQVLICFKLLDWDLGVCLFYECRRKQLRKPAPLNSWLDLRATYRVCDKT
jgi:hypothetical protein